MAAPLNPNDAAERLKAFAHSPRLRHAKLVDFAQVAALRCYDLCRPRLVEDMLALIGRGDPVVSRSLTAMLRAKKMP